MTGKLRVPAPSAKRATQHIRLPNDNDAYEHSYILTVPSSLAPLRPYAGRYTVASRFRCQPCGCGIHCPRASDGSLSPRPYLVGYVRWDARSNQDHLLVRQSFSTAFQLATKRKQGNRRGAHSAPKTVNPDADDFVMRGRQHGQERKREFLPWAGVVEDPMHA